MGLDGPVLGARARIRRSTRSANAGVPIGVAVLAAGLYTLFRPGRRREAILANGRSPAAERAVDLEAGPGAVVAAGLAGAEAAPREPAAEPDPAAVEAEVLPAARSESTLEPGEAGRGDAHKGPHPRRFARHEPPMRG